MKNKFIHISVSLTLLVYILVTGCAPLVDSQPVLAAAINDNNNIEVSKPEAQPTSSRPEYEPGELVDYIAQTGDSLPALATHFNTTVEEIKAANPGIPADVTTMPPGMPMKIPIYYLPLWGTTYQSIPDTAFVNGPQQSGFSTSAFVATKPGWIKNYSAYAGGENRTGAQIVDYVAINFSVSPRLLLAILEYQTGALSQENAPEDKNLLGHKERYYESLYLQLVWAANTLNNGYYGWRSGKLTNFDLADGSLIRPDPWQNAGSVGIQYYFSQLYGTNAFQKATNENGLASTYFDLFSDPWDMETEPLIPGSLRQPYLRLPFPPGKTWTLTGGPHTGFGKGEPFAALDFAPASEHSGCFVPESQHYSAAMADGIIVRNDIGLVAQDLDGDGDERTGWVIIYFHIATPGKAIPGEMLRAGDPVGYPSCEGGTATGTHVHVARKYNGEWITAGGVIPFEMEGWVTHDGQQAYHGTLTKGSQTVTASENSDLYSQITSDYNPSQ
ncbi:MAG: LysM peptidoglycan-binding domain-containing protein [Anaerolineales bacterium]|nr:LysM peptidoglycan-binding domain-containing protein [Anaerolineales bacterium]